LLSSASLRTGHFALHTRPTDLEVVIEEALLATQPLLALKGQYLRVKSPSPLRSVQTDARRLHQVLINLISNASKYGPQSAPIIVWVTEESEHVCVRVVDHGPGIPPEMQEQLFQPFVRHEKDEQSGIGLGLSIVKAIVERHGGTVGVESGRSGEGTIFWFTLPYAAA
ncbi:MAG: sensor histidine kinase, partial [Ardenticatenaceae bacterium]